MPAITAMVETYLPALVTAGDYARRIQPRISAPARKAGQNPWVQALTDADQSVQTFFELTTLGHFPEADFFGEEQDLSRNTGYFPAGAATKVWLDPIDGTWLYQNQRSGWQIILSITRDARLMAVICYLPVSGRFNLAVRGCGAFTGGRDCRTLNDMQPLATRSGSRVCVAYQAPAELEKLRGSWNAFDIVADDDPQRDFENLNDLFTGRLDGFVSQSCDLLDWGALGYIVANAGGTVSGLDGRPLDIFENFSARSSPILVSSSPEVHQHLLATINGPR
ncbi:MAG: inositol monophosphatase family protein [Gammaproteobacteria bacterium]